MKIASKILILLSLFVSFQASAQTVAVCQPSPCASEITQRALYTYLNGTNPLSGTDAGLIAQVTLLNDSLAKLTAQQTQAVPNGDLGNRTLAADQDVAKTLADGTRPPSATSCRNSSRSGAGGGSSGAAGSTGEAQDDLNEKDLSRLQQPRNTASSAGELVTNQSDFCTAANVADKTPGCTSVGSVPGANVMSTSILLPAKEKGVQQPARTIELSKTKQVHAGGTFVKMTAPRPAPDIKVGAKATTEGKVYLAYKQRYTARAASVLLALNYTFGQALEPKSKMPADEKAEWDKLKTQYSQVYPGSKFPENPSPNERLAFQVYRQYSKEQMSDDANADEKELAKRNLEMQQLNAKLLLKMIERQDQTNILLANILSNDLDPAQRQELESLASNVRGSQTTAPASK